MPGLLFREKPVQLYFPASVPDPTFGDTNNLCAWPREGSQTGQLPGWVLPDRPCIVLLPDNFLTRKQLASHAQLTGFPSSSVSNNCG